MVDSMLIVVISINHQINPFIWQFGSQQSQERMYFDSKIKQMNRKNDGNQWPVHPTHITVQNIDNTAAFRSSQMTLGTRASRQVIQGPHKWTFPLTLQKLQPYLMTIHTNLIKNLKRKLLQRQLTVQEQQLIECSRHDKYLQEFISGILAIESCVKELTKEHTATVVAFTKATNLLLINYKFLYLEYAELKNTVRTSESLTNCQQGKSDGFMKFFDSLKFLALVIKNAFMQSEQGSQESREQQNTAGSSLWDSWRYQLRKLQDLMSFQSILNMEKSSLLGQNLKLLDQKMVSLHNQQQQIIISQLQKQNNFLRWQVFSKDNTITEYEESIYNVDLSKYRENEEREEYWARRVKFSRGSGGCLNHNINNYSQLLNDGSGISHQNQGKIQLNMIEEKILEPEGVQENEGLTKHLNILSKKMEELQLENKTLRDKLKYIEQNHMQQNQQLIELRHKQTPLMFTLQPTTTNKKKQRKYSQKYSQSSHHTQSDKYQFERQKLDLLIKEIEEMKTIIIELEEKEVGNRELVREKNAEISRLEKILEEKERVIERLNKENQQVNQKVQSLQETINNIKQQLSQLTIQLSTKTHQLQNKFLQLNNKSQQLQHLNTQLTFLSQTIQKKQNQVIFLSSELNFMNDQFAKQMEKYNTVFYKISQELSASLQKADSLENDNLKLTQKNIKLQQDNLKKQAIILDFQTRFACTTNDIYTSTFGAHNNNPYLSNYNRNITARKSSKFQANSNINLANIQPTAQHLYTRQPIKSARKISKTPLKQYEHPPDMNKLHQLPKINHQNHLNEPHNKPQTNHPNESLQIQTPTVHNHYHHYVNREPLTPAKRLSLRRQQDRNDERSKSPIDAREVSRKKITIKVQGNKLVNQIVQKKESTVNYQLNHIPTTNRSDRKSALMTRIQTIRNEKIEKQNHASPSFSQQNHNQRPKKSPQRQSSSPEFKKTANQSIDGGQEAEKYQYFRQQNGKDDS